MLLVYLLATGLLPQSISLTTSKALSLKLSTYIVLLPLTIDNNIQLPVHNKNRLTTTFNSKMFFASTQQDNLKQDHNNSNLEILKISKLAFEK